jgi:hypothetical protein
MNEDQGTLLSVRALQHSIEVGLFMFIYVFIYIY